MNQRKISSVDKRLSSFYSSVELESTNRPIYNSLRSGEYHYTEKVLIAEGGMKKVYSVYDSRADRKVALAEPLPLLDTDDIEAFLKEARLTARLDHPNIIKVHDVGLDVEGTAYFTMDLKTGQNLSEYIKTTKSSLQDRLFIFQKICDAVSYAHYKGVVHLDLKPENIQIGEFGEVMICDWGLSFVYKNKSFKKDYDIGTELYSKATQNNVVKGTPGFMAPEQITKDNISEQTDVFALGIILHFLMTQKLPFTGSADDIMQQTLSKPTKEPSLNYPEFKLPLSLDAVFLKSTKIPMEERYITVQELSLDIKAYLEGFTTTAENAGLLRRFLMLIKRNKTIFSVITASLIIISGMIFQYVHDMKVATQLALEESEKVKALNDQYVKDFTEQSLLITDNYKVPFRLIPFSKKLEILNKVIEMDPKAQQPQVEKAQLLFMMQNFEESLPLLKKFKSPLIEACEVAINYSKNGKFTDEAMKLVVDKVLNIPTQEKIVNGLLFYDMQVRRRSLKTKLYFAQKVIMHLNPGVIQSDIFHDYASKTLTLSGKIKILENIHLTNPIRLIMPFRVILKNTEIEKLHFFYELGIKELDIRGSKIKQLKWHYHDLKYFHKVIVRKDQYIQYKNLPDCVQIVIGDPVSE